jgi:photosystem II stability/assembly factor-like uncharacterized protein
MGLLRSKVNDMAFGNNAWYAATDDGLLVSRDRGLNWRAVSLAPNRKTAAPPSSVSTASIRAVRTGKGDSYIWAIGARQIEVSGDSGKTWMAHALPFEPRGRVHFLPSDENAILLAGDQGVFVSRDSGASWQQSKIADPIADSMIDDLTSVRNDVVVATARGALYRSSDSGKSWTKISAPGTENTLSALRSRDAGNQLVAASSTEGLFVLDMGSASSASADSVADQPAAKQ